MKLNIPLIENRRKEERWSKLALSKAIGLSYMGLWHVYKTERTRFHIVEALAKVLELPESKLIVFNKKK
jgi:DNA-binding Xre family transcriptional regulator